MHGTSPQSTLACNINPTIPWGWAHHHLQAVPACLIHPGDQAACVHEVTQVTWGPHEATSPWPAFWMQRVAGRV